MVSSSLEMNMLLAVILIIFVGAFCVVFLVFVGATSLVTFNLIGIFF
jgi:hypothetical protein